MAFVGDKSFDSSVVRIPAEWEPHACCWMAWAFNSNPDWQKRNADPIKRQLANVICNIAEFEPVRLLTPPAEFDEAQERVDHRNVKIVEAQVDDIWMRDIAPTFAVQGNEVVAIDFNFNGWGDTKERPRRFGDDLVAHSIELFGVRRIRAAFVAEGGSIITDGNGTVITTRSCLLNPNRNRVRPYRQQDIERSFNDLGVRRVIWLEGDPCEPISSGHIDGYVLFTAPGAVAVEAIDDPNIIPLYRTEDIATLEQSGLQVRQVLAPRTQRRSRYWAPCYLNAYVTNGAVITACFGDDERDEAARIALAMAFPGRKVVTLRINHIANEGGGIHCLTQPMPAFREERT